MYEVIDKLEEQVNAVLPGSIKTLIECRANFYAELANGWHKDDMKKAANAYIQSMLVVLGGNK